MKIEQTAGGILATVKHTCGHEDTLFYATVSFARLDQRKMEGRKCVSCLFKEEQEMLKDWRARVS